MNNQNAQGYCPTCGMQGVTRERRPNGNDTCEAGHDYVSILAKPSRAHKGKTADEQTATNEKGGE